MSEQRDVVTSVHLVDGSVIEGKPDRGAAAAWAISKENKKAFADVIGRGDGWQVNVETNDGWVCIPKHAVLYVRISAERGF